MADGYSPAFPYVVPPSAHTAGQSSSTYNGMNLRTYIAVEMAKGLLASGFINGPDYTQLDEVAIRLADKLLTRL